MLPAPAQGAIGIECRSDDASTMALLQAIDHSETHQAVLAERAFTRAWAVPVIRRSPPAP
jgi:hydroxymethylbilane synthase